MISKCTRKHQMSDLLIKVIEKRQQREKVKQLEEERVTKKTGLEKILEIRAMKLTTTNNANTTTNNSNNHNAVKRSNTMTKASVVPSTNHNTTNQSNHTNNNHQYSGNSIAVTQRPTVNVTPATNGKQAVINGSGRHPRAGVTSITITADSTPNTNNGTTTSTAATKTQPHNNNHEDSNKSTSQVKLILKAIESSNGSLNGTSGISHNKGTSGGNTTNVVGRSNTSAAKFCKRLDFPSAGNPWSPTSTASSNYVR